MITVDGIQINRVTSIICNSETGFDIEITFHIDDRISGTTDPDIFTDYEVEKFEDEKKDTVDCATLIIPNETGYKTYFINDNE